MTYDEICRAVKRLKTKYGETDPARLCEAMGILLLLHPMGSEENALKGFFMECRRTPAITVNTDLPEAVRRIIIAHELGHAVLHRHGGISAFHDVAIFDRTSLCEKEANIFAAELLLEDEAVLNALNRDGTFFAAAAELMVPAELLDFKFRVLKWKGYQLMESPVSARSDFLKDMDMPGNDDDHVC